MSNKISVARVLRTASIATLTFFVSAPAFALSIGGWNPLNPAPPNPFDHGKQDPLPLPPIGPVNDVNKTINKAAGDVASTLGKAAHDAGTTISKAAGDTWRTIVKAGSDAGEFVWKGITWIPNVIKGWWNGLLSSVGTAVSGVENFLSHFAIELIWAAALALLAIIGVGVVIGFAGGKFSGRRRRFRPRRA